MNQGMMGNRKGPISRYETKTMKLRQVKNDIEETLKLIQYHDDNLKIYGKKLANLIQNQKTLETTK